MTAHELDIENPPVGREKVELSVSKESRLRTIAFLGNYLPRKCGIATFTSDLLRAVAGRRLQNRCFAVAMNEPGRTYEYPPDVRYEIQEQDEECYRRAAEFLNSSCVDVVSIQHEFGIFGGPAGSHLLTLLRELRVPVVTTLHTVLRKPNGDQHRVMQELIERSTRLVVMTERGRNILMEVYDAPPAKIDLIPHGIPDVTFVTPEHYKDQFNARGKKVLLTFGLLSPNKGIEHVLNALPEILAEFPDVIYILLGATHPHELETRGEAYRLSLEAIVARHGIAKNVMFHNQFVELMDLTEFIGAADIYLTPYLDQGQITSGTLAYAFGAGKAVISTPYWHAAELLSDDRGVLVPFADSGAIAREVTGLLRDDTRREAMSSRAYQLGRSMVWSNTADLYLGVFESARRELESLPLSGLVVFTDGADNARTSFADQLLSLRAKSVPVFAVGIGAEQYGKDIEIRRVETARTVLKGSTLVADVLLRQRGYPGAKVPLVVEDDGRIVGTSEIVLPSTGDLTSVPVHVQLNDAGARSLTFRVPLQAGEQVTQNNEQRAVVRVRNVRERILYVEGEPRYEMRFIRAAVAADSNLQLVALQRTAEGKFLRLDVDSPEELVAGFPTTRAG